MEDTERLRKALELDRAGEWGKAHEMAQQVDTVDGYWVHAYLHRKEGDLANAAFWYSRAQQPVPGEGESLEAEWERLHAALR